MFISFSFPSLFFALLDMLLEHVTASSSIDPAAPATLISVPSDPSHNIHTTDTHQDLPQPESAPTSAPSQRSSSSSSLAEHTERIPRLSATTTEILARVNGNIKDSTSTVQGPGITEYSNSGYNESNSLGTNNTETGTEIMKVPSTTTVTFPPTHPAEPGKETTSTSTLKSEPIHQDISPNIQDENTNSVDKVVTPNQIQPKATLLPTPAATTTPSTSNTSSTSSTTKRQKNATRRGNGGAKPGKKRKRASKHDDNADLNGDGSSSDEAAPSATQTKSGRQIQRPSFLTPAQKKEPKAKSPEVQPIRKRRRIYRKGKEINVTCNHCQRGHSPTSNAIVFCDECNGAWHQFCHDPPIGNEVIQVKEAEWFCKECRPVGNAPDSSADTVGVYPDVKPAEKIDKLVSIPFSTKVGGEQFSEAEKHAHLSRLSHTALVNLLMDISNSNPSLPIFPSNLPHPHSSNYIPQSDTATSTPGTSMTTSMSTTNTSLVSTAPTSTQSTNNNTPPVVIPGPSLNRGAGEPEDDEYEDVEEHRLYPRPGNGFRLPPESEDIDMLLEDPMCPTFSHSLHGPAKARAEASGMMGVSGMA